MLNLHESAGTTRGCHRWGRAVYGFWTLWYIVYSFIFYQRNMVFLLFYCYYYSCESLCLPHNVVCMWQRVLICWDIIVLMRRSLKLLWGFAEAKILSGGRFYWNVYKWQRMSHLFTYWICKIVFFTCICVYMLTWDF